MLFENNISYNTLKVLLIVIGTLGMMCSTTKFQYSRKRIALIFSLYLCYVSVSSALIIALCGFVFLMRIFLFTISIPAIGLVFKMATDTPAKAVFNYSTQILFSLYVAATITLINTAINGSELTDFLVRFAAYSLIIILEYRFLRRPFLQLTAIAENGWLILALVPCSLMVFSVALATYPIPYTQNPTSIVLIYLLAAVIVILYFSIFQYLFMQCRLQMAKQNMELLEFQVGHLKDKITADMIVAEKVRIDKHDTRHRFQTIAALLENGKTTDALDYIHQSVFQFQSNVPVQYCHDIILNATLSSYFMQAEQSEITLETYLSFPEPFPFESAEFAIVIANALENAINACRKLPKEERKIVFKCAHKPKLMLEISNPCKEVVPFSEDGLPLSKEKGHGLGTRSIMAFCKKYNAFYDFSLEKELFVVRVVL